LVAHVFETHIFRRDALLHLDNLVGIANVQQIRNLSRLEREGRFTHDRRDDPVIRIERERRQTPAQRRCLRIFAELPRDVGEVIAAFQTALHLVHQAG
jgi:hypothetical protein